MSKYFHQLNPIFADIVLNPSFKQADLDRIKKTYYSDLKQRYSSNDWILSTQLKNLFLTHTNRLGRIVSQKSVESIQKPDLHRFRSHFLLLESI